MGSHALGIRQQSRCIISMSGKYLPCIAHCAKSAQSSKSSVLVLDMYDV